MNKKIARSVLVCCFQGVFMLLFVLSYWQILIFIFSWQGSSVTRHFSVLFYFGSSHLKVIVECSIAVDTAL
jgi:hypothetical protein